MVDNDNGNVTCFAIVSNIPPHYHSCDLRNYFSQFIESKGFDCFHFRHRPETKIKTTPSSSCQDIKKGKCTTCCLVKLSAENLKKLLKMYNGKHWTGNDDEVMSQICYISKVKPPTGIARSGDPKFTTRGQQKVIPADREIVTDSDFQNLPEFHPPNMMPNGNVGTPTMVFLDFIKQCRLPPSIIKKLGLTFPKTLSTKQYGRVAFDYGEDHLEKGGMQTDHNDFCTASGNQIVTTTVSDSNIIHHISDKNNSFDKKVIVSETQLNQTDNSKQHDQEPVQSEKKKLKSWRDEEAKKRMELHIEENMIENQSESEEDNDSCEEWERHEALYDDVSNQERNKERLFEEKIELKWEKGGSGLVFYTDAQYWQKEDGDFDEQTADDWDVDMGAYYEKGAADKDALDFLAMRQEKRRRDGIEPTDRITAGIAVKKHKQTSSKGHDDVNIGKFEIHTKGVGRKILEQQGWTEGQGLGHSVRGISDALDSDGQNPRDKKGLGYHGEKLDRKPRTTQHKVIISTIYDNPCETDKNETLLRSNAPYHLKYRDNVKFTKSGMLD